MIMTRIEEHYKKFDGLLYMIHCLVLIGAANHCRQLSLSPARVVIIHPLVMIYKHS